MTKVLNAALVQLANEGLRPASLTLTVDQFRALVTDLSQAQVFQPPPTFEGAPSKRLLASLGRVQMLAPWGYVSILCEGAWQP